ncbi:MAG: amino acid ABC transporter permease [Oscillospiraceae bacterium]
MILGVFNAICKIYTTIIRGTPMMVQLLIMSLVIFASSRNFTMIGILAPGHQLRRLCGSEIVRGGLMSVDAGQMEAGRILGLNYFDDHALHRHPAGDQKHPAGPRQRVYHPAQGYVPHHRHRRQGADRMRLKAVIAKTYQGLFPLFGIALMYLLLVMLFSKLLGVLERRLRQSDRR